MDLFMSNWLEIRKQTPAVCQSFKTKFFQKKNFCMERIQVIIISFKEMPDKGTSNLGLSLSLLLSAYRDSVEWIINDL